MSSLAGADELVARHGGRVVETVDELLDSCDVVDLATPTPTHAELALAALAAGRPVVCEKPLARTSAEAEQVIAGFEAAGLALYPGHVVRFFGEYAAMHAAVDAGAIGQIAVQRFTRTGSAPAAGWFHDDALSGGLLLDQSLHDLDFARWNAGEVATAYALESAADGVRSVQVVLTHVGGALSFVHGTWARPGTRFRTTFDIAGTGGVLQHDSAEHPALSTDLGALPAPGEGPGTVGACCPRCRTRARSGPSWASSWRRCAAARHRGCPPGTAWRRSGSRRPPSGRWTADGPSR